MSLDILLTGAVVLVALIYVIRRIMRPGCSGCAKDGGGCSDSSGRQCPPLMDLSDKNDKEPKS